jgi:hypothetical protein
MTTEFLPVEPALERLLGLETFSGGGGPRPDGGMLVDLMSFRRSSMEGGARI